MKATFSYLVDKNKLEHWTIYHFSTLQTTMVKGKGFFPNKEIPMLLFQMEEGTYATYITSDDNGNEVVRNISETKFREQNVLFDNRKVRYLTIEKK